MFLGPCNHTQQQQLRSTACLQHNLGTGCSHFSDACMQNYSQACYSVSCTCTSSVSSFAAVCERISTPAIVNPVLLHLLPPALLHT